MWWDIIEQFRNIGRLLFCPENYVYKTFKENLTVLRILEEKWYL